MENQNLKHKPLSKLNEIDPTVTMLIKIIAYKEWIKQNLYKSASK